MNFIETLPLLQIHITAVFVTLGIVVIADSHGLLWVLGKLKTLPAARMNLLHWATWTGLAVILTAGVFMFLGYGDYLLTLTAFRFKLLFVFALLINAFVIGKHMHIASSTSFAELSKKERFTLLFSGAVSGVCWIGAFVSAQFLT